MLASAVSPGAPPKGIDATLLGSIIGYTGCMSGLNFILINYYRDHGYGMGSKIGFFSGVIGGQKQDVLPSGVTFPESEKNTKLWNRWFRYLAIDQWSVFFIGAMIGMFIPSALCVTLTKLPGAGVPTVANIPVYVATEMSKISIFFFPFILLLGAVILFKSQFNALEFLVRNTTEAANTVSPRLRAWTAGDPRKAYYSLAIVFIIVIGVLIHLALPTELLQISANMANLASLIFPFVLIYLNAKLPEPARARWWSIVVLLANVGVLRLLLRQLRFFEDDGTTAGQVRRPVTCNIRACRDSCGLPALAGRPLLFVPAWMVQAWPCKAAEVKRPFENCPLPPSPTS